MERQEAMEWLRKRLAWEQWLRQLHQTDVEPGNPEPQTSERAA